MAVTPRKLTNFASITKYFRELQNYVSKTGRLVSATASTLTVTEALHENKTVLIDRAAGVAVTLPAATGSGARYRFVVKTSMSGGNTTITRAGSDVMKGFAHLTADDATALGGFSTTSATVITLDGSTRGGYAGDVVELEDIASAVWAVRVLGRATGSEATPFS